MPSLVAITPTPASREEVMEREEGVGRGVERGLGGLGKGGRKEEWRLSLWKEVEMEEMEGRAMVRGGE